MTDRLRADVKRPTLLWLSALFLGLAILLTALSFVVDSIQLGGHALGGWFELAAAGLGVWLALILVWWCRQQGRFDPFELPVWFSLNAYVQVVLNVWLFQRELSFRSPWLLGNEGSTASQAVLLMGVGLTALWAGYARLSQQLQSQPRLVGLVPRRPRWPLLGIAWLVSWSLEAVAVVASWTGYLAGTELFAWTAYLGYVTLVGDLVTFAFLLQHFQRPTRIGWLWLAFVLGSEVVLGLVIGTKSTVLVFLYVIMAIYYTRRRLAKTWLVIGLLALLVIVPVVNAFRVNLSRAGYSTSGGTSFEGRVPILLESVQQAVSRPISDLTAETRDTFEQRQGGLLEITAAVMAVHPRIRPYVGLDMLAYMAEQSIPRLVWLDKPTGRPELYLILTTYLGARYEYSLATPGLFADAYRAGGWLFAVLWFWMLGALMAWFYQQGPHQGTLAGTAFYLLMLTQFVTYNSNVMRLLLEIIKFGVPTWFLTMYVLFEPVRVEHTADRNPLHGKLEHDSGQRL